MLFEVQKSDGDFVGLFSCNVGRNDQFVLRHIFLSKVLPIIDDCTAPFCVTCEEIVDFF